MNSQQLAVPCTIMRGGTSKAVFMRIADVPSEPAMRERFLLALFGSPDKRQIDRLGGADPLTSKFAMIGPPTRPDADIDYTFAQIGIEEAYVSYEIVCGNISSATDVYAIEEGLVPAVEPVITVRVHNTNTNSILIIKVSASRDTAGLSAQSLSALVELHPRSRPSGSSANSAAPAASN